MDPSAKPPLSPAMIAARKEREMESAAETSGYEDNDRSRAEDLDESGYPDHVMGGYAEDDGEADGEAVSEWDEGGPSHCGYHEVVHATLMSVGRSVHVVVGDPSDGIEGSMNKVGNWFQEASYVVRDFMRGNKRELEDDASETFGSMHRDAMDAFGMTGNKDSVPQ